ncbi:MAG TPA: hypothetical protein VKB52_08685 [Rhodanobacteraceae bacterium]|nr:hypothetical protein [Rhodanobacteraceae bacterium]
MFAHRITLAVTLAFATPNAHAFFDAPWITPATPRAGEVVSVNIRDGICDAIFEHPGYPQITQQGNFVRLVEYGHHWDTADLCIYDIGTLVEPLGAFPPGDYTVTVDFVYNDYLYGPTIINLGVTPFSVTGATPAMPVPTLSDAGVLALLTSMGCIAALHLKRGLNSERASRSI